jgi:hypothetical protein
MIMPCVCTVPTTRALLQVFALPLLKILALYKGCSSAFQARFALAALKVLLSRISPPHVRILCKDGLFKLELNATSYTNSIRCNSPCN